MFLLFMYFCSSVFLSLFASLLMSLCLYACVSLCRYVLILCFCRSFSVCDLFISYSSCFVLFFRRDFGLPPRLRKARLPDIAARQMQTCAIQEPGEVAWRQTVYEHAGLSKFR